MKAKLKTQHEKLKAAGAPLALTFTLLIFNFAFVACALKANRGGVPAQVQSAVDSMTEDVAEGRFEKIYNEASEEWRRAITLEESNATFKRLKERLGNVKSRSQHEAAEREDADGHSFIITYRTTFDLGDGMETFTLVEREGRWLLARYFVNSDALK